MEGASLGSVHSSYIHGHAWLSDWDMSWGAGAGSAPGASFRGSYPCRRAWGLGWGSPHLNRGEKGQPLPGHCTLLEEILGRALSPRPPPSPSPCPQSGVVGEVADRFPGQHRGRLGWSSGQQGRGQVSPGTPQPIPWACHPAVTAPFGPAALQTSLVFHPLKPGRPGSCCTCRSQRLGLSSGSLTG